MSTSVFVSGATGFIAQHIVKLLLSKNYKVVGSVRSAEKGEYLKNLLASENFSYEVVPNIKSVGAFDKALENHPEVTVFLHTASPLTLQVEDIEEDLLKPAVEGTINVLNAIKAHGSQIKHVVVTSSLAAIFDTTRAADSTYVLTEETWNPISWEDSKTDPFSGYCGSKKLAEKAAWEFVKSEKPSYTFNVINPSYVFGPQAFDETAKGDLNVSSQIISGLLGLNPDSAVPQQDSIFIDVRDVAKAHLAAFENGFSNERLLLNAQGFTSQAILDILHKNFESLKTKLPVGNPGDYLDVVSPVTFVTKKTEELLNFPFIDLETSVVDAVSQILRVKEA